jgi:5'-nucleotidase/UDP-sugar diphosphatase
MTAKERKKVESSVCVGHMASFHLRVLCVGDVYSETPVRGRGGYAELARVVARMRSEWSQQGGNGGGEWHVLLVGLGDVLGGSNMCEITRGKHVVELMNAHRASTPAPCRQPRVRPRAGRNHVLAAPRVRESAFHWLAANVFIVDALLPAVLPHVVHTYTLPDKRVVRVGLLRPLHAVHTPVLSYPSDAVRFEASSTPRAAAVAALLRGELQCDLVVALTHQTFFEDKSLVKQVRGIDLVLGGHDHDAIAAVSPSPRASATRSFSSRA